MRRRIVLASLLIGSPLVLLAAPLVGAKWVQLSAIVGSADATSTMIFWDIRLPRACLAWIAGAGLAVGGMAFQGMFRNVLAEPYTLGVSGGAALGAALCVRIGLDFQFLGFSGATAGGMGGALAAIGLVYGLTRLRPRFATATVLLAGVAANFFFSSLILLVQYTADLYDTFRILRWMMGGLQMVGFDAPLRTAPVVVLVSAIIWRYGGELNLMALGDELAISRGVEVAKVKKVLFFSVSFMVGAVVSICGPIGFVGMIVPHICRLLVGSEHRVLMPAALLFGGAFLVICDTVSRTVFAPAELPVGIFTALLGGPFFVWLLLRPPKGEKAFP